MQKRDELASKFIWIEQAFGDRGYFMGETFSLVDAVYGTIFRYFDVFDTVSEFGVFTDTPKVKNWRKILQSRSSIQCAVAEDYAPRLLVFLKQHNSYLSMLIESSNS